MGSIETSDYEKRIYAHHSLQYNLNDATFCELFPDDVQVGRPPHQGRGVVWRGRVATHCAVNYSGAQCRIMGIMPLLCYNQLAYTLMH